MEQELYQRINLILGESKATIKEITVDLKSKGITEDDILKIQREVFPHRNYRLLEDGDFEGHVDLDMVIAYLKPNPQKIYSYYHQQNAPNEEIYFIDENPNNFLLTNLLSLNKEQYEYMNKWFNKTPFTTVDKEFSFDSCHRLYDYDGPCNRYHGHTYKMKVYIRRRVNLQTDMVLDFGDLKKLVKKHIVDNFDHWDLTTKITEFQTTAENMVYWVWNKLEKEALIKGLSKIEIWETPTSRATLTAEDILSSVYIHSYYKDIKKYG